MVDDCMKNSQSVLTLLLLLTAVGCATSQHNCDLPKNSEVRWTAGFLGFSSVPLKQEAVVRVRNEGASASGELLKCFDDPERFVVAHLTLTYIYGGVFGNDDDKEWNGLHVKLLPDGIVSYPNPDDRLRLKAEWQNYIRNHPVAATARRR